MELLASGRMAEVFAWGDGRVLKLDRPEWSGIAAVEAAVLATHVRAIVKRRERPRTPSARGSSSTEGN